MANVRLSNEPDHPEIEVTDAEAADLRAMGFVWDDKTTDKPSAGPEATANGDNTRKENK